MMLGKRYRDTISGFEGIATGVFDYLYGCRRVNLEGSVDGKPVGHIFDAPQLEEVEGQTIAPSPAASSGGSRQGPPPRPS